MIKLGVFLVFLLVSVLAGGEGTDDGSGDINLRSIIFGFKGFLKGWQQGLYNDDYFELDEDCLNSDRVGPDFMFVYDFLNGRSAPRNVL